MACIVVEVENQKEAEEYSYSFPKDDWYTAEEEYCKKYELQIDSDICIIVKIKGKPCTLEYGKSTAA